MNADGTGTHAMGLEGLNGDPVWFPDGKRLLDGHGGPGPASGIWEISAAGGTPRRVLTVPGDTEGLALSPDGTQVALIRNRRQLSALFVATVGGAAMKQLTPWSLKAKPKLDWSPDGELLLSRTEDGRVFTIRSDGSGLKVLTKGPDYCSESFSPDGTKVLFIDHCSEGGVRSHIYSMNADGTAVKRIPGLLGHWVSRGAARA